MEINRYLKLDGIIFYIENSMTINIKFFGFLKGKNLEKSE